jgi:hypothetical protein
MDGKPTPFAATGNDGRRYTVSVVYDEFDGMIGRIAYFTNRHTVRREMNGTFVVVETGVVLEPDSTEERQFPGRPVGDQSGFTGIVGTPTTIVT